MPPVPPPFLGSDCLHRGPLCAFLSLVLLSLAPALHAQPAAATLKGQPFTRFYSFDQIGNVFRGARLSFDAEGRVAVVHDGVYSVLNDESWIDLMEERPERESFQSVASDADGTRYYGAVGSWGLLEPTPEGRLSTVSMVPSSLPGWAVNATFGEITLGETGVFFAGRTGIAYWSKASRETTFIHVPGLAHLFRLGSDHYVSTFDRGTFRLNPETGVAEPAPEWPLRGAIVDNTSTLPSGHAILSTFSRELFLWDGVTVTPLQSTLGERMEGRITALQALPEGLFALAINGKGLYLLNPEGAIITSLTDPEYRLVSALGNNEPGILWAATESGISKIHYGAPVTTFGQALGLSIGWPQFVTWNERLIVASNGRVFEQVVGTPGEPSRFRLMDPQPGSGAWGIATHADWLLLGNSEGVFAATPGRPLQRVLDAIAVARLQMLESGECLVIGEEVITAMQLEDGTWRECAARTPGVGYPSTVHASRSAAWVELGPNRVARIALSGGALDVRVLDTFPWNGARWVNVSVLGSTVVLNGPESGRFFFDEETQAPVENPRLETLLQQMPYWPSRIRPENPQRWWVSHAHGVFTVDPSTVPLSPDTVTYREIHEHSPLVQLLPGGAVLASNGRTLLSLARPAAHPAPRQISPRLVSLQDLRTGRERVSHGLRTLPVLRLDHDENTLGLRFFAGTYSLRAKPEYEFRINQGPWSRLEGTSHLRLSDLREGTYRFAVRLRDSRGPVGTETSFSFFIAPPWFRSSWAVSGYILCGLAAVFGVVRFFLRRARAKTAALETVVAHRTRELKATMEKLQQEVQTTATLAERNRMAGEIHDGVEQGLAGLAMQMEAIAQFQNCPPDVQRELSVAVNLLAYSRKEMRHVVQNLHSPELANVDLGTALRRTFERVAPARIPVEVATEGAARRLTPSIEHDLLRIAQEAVSNALQHAAPTRIRVTLHLESSEVTLSVEDDGSGFEVGTAPGGELGHFGLQSFKARSERLGGQLKILSEPGAGTRVTVRVPLEPHAHQP